MSLHADAVARDISPAKPVQLCGYPHVRRISTGIHDALLASALFLRNGSSAVLLCSLDLLMLNCDVARRFRRHVAGALEIPEACVLISCTHTHSAPVTLRYLPFEGDIAMPPVDPAYLQFVERRVVEAALAAKQQARPAELAWTIADASGVGGNRHFVNGPTDPEVGVLAVRAHGRLLAVAMVYGMHPTVLHEDSTLVSADFPHYTRLQLQENLGRDLVVLYHNGAAGDQSPRHHVGSQTFAEAERLGRKLGNAVHLENVEFNDQAVLAGSLQPVDFPRRKFPTVREAREVLSSARTEYERLKTSGAERAHVRTAEVSVFGAEVLLKFAQAQQTSELDRVLDAQHPFEVQVLRIGGVCIAGLPGEFFVEYALRLKRRAAKKSFVVTYANGELQGYIVTPAAAAAGGYEASSSMFPPAAGDIMLETALKMIARPTE